MYYYYARVEIHGAARKHGIGDDDIRQEAEYALVGYALEQGQGEPRRTLLLGPDRAGNLLEIIVLELDDGSRLAIHAMRMRPGYNDLLP
ncbi:MAG: hypothetical protein ABR569_12695 [Gaiellaceae bacterium]